jgi:hypothetical protein
MTGPQRAGASETGADDLRTVFHASHASVLGDSFLYKQNGPRISEMREIAVCNIRNQFSFSGIAPTTSFVRSHNAIFCATPKRARRLLRYSK